MIKKRVINEFAPKQSLEIHQEIPKPIVLVALLAGEGEELKNVSHGSETLEKLMEGKEYDY